MTRYTNKDAFAAFERLARAYNLTIGTLPGAYGLDTYQGYKIIRYCENGGEAEPFGSRRYTAESFVHAVGFAIDAKHIADNA
jgi:hypothetical protein